VQALQPAGHELDDSREAAARWAFGLFLQGGRWIRGSVEKQNEQGGRVFAKNPKQRRD
jgi:hypothetical protein